MVENDVAAELGKFESKDPDRVQQFMLNLDKQVRKAKRDLASMRKQTHQAKQAVMEAETRVIVVSKRLGVNALPEYPEWKQVLRSQVQEAAEVKSRLRDEQEVHNAEVAKLQVCIRDGVDAEGVRAVELAQQRRREADEFCSRLQVTRDYINGSLDISLYELRSLVEEPAEGDDDEDDEGEWLAHMEEMVHPIVEKPLKKMQRHHIESIRALRISCNEDLDSRNEMVKVAGSGLLSQLLLAPETVRDEDLAEKRPELEKLLSLAHEIATKGLAESEATAAEDSDGARYDDWEVPVFTKSIISLSTAGGRLARHVKRVTFADNVEAPMELC